jgi:hypothetical protein
MELLSLSDEYFNGVYSNFIVEDFDILIAEITKNKIKYFELKDNYYKYTAGAISSVTMDKIEQKADLYEKVNFDDII